MFECLSTSTYVHLLLAWCLWRPEEGIWPPETGVIQSCKFPCGWQEPKWQEKQVPLTVEPPLQPTPEAFTKAYPIMFLEPGES